MDKLLISLLLIVCILVILNFVKCLKPQLFNSIEHFQTTTEEPEETSSGPSNTTEKPEKPEKPEESKDYEETCDTLKKTSDYKNLPNFNFDSESNSPCQDELYKTMKIEDTDDLSKEYTLSFLFKLNSENKDNKDNKESLVTIKNQLNIYIQNNILYVLDHLNREHTVLSLTENKIENSDKSKDIEDLFDSELSDESIPVYKHFAIISSYLDEEHTKMKILIFMNGIKDRFIIKSPLEFSNKDILFGINTDTTINSFSGSIINPLFETNIIDESTLCSRWNSCGMFECSYREDEDNTNTRNECHDNCMKYSDCNDNSCNNKCFNEHLSSWKFSCDFEPSGSTKQNCNKQCLNMKNCRYDECETICSNCDDKNKCPWTKDKNDYEDDFMFDPKLLTCKSCVPPILDITIPKNRELKITWSQPFKISNNEYVKNKYNKYELDEDIDMFIFILSKKGNPDEGEQVLSYKVPNGFKEKVSTYNKDMEKTKPNNIYNIPNLDLDEYNIVCKSVKLHGGACNSDSTDTTASPSDSNDMVHTIGDSSHIYNITPKTKHMYSSTEL